MAGDIKKLGKETIIYGISTILARFLNFILLPLYTYYLLPDEYGVVATVFSIIAFFNVIYGLGLNQGYMRYFKEKNSLSMTVTSIFFSSFILSFLLVILSKPISSLFQMSTYSSFIIYAAAILYFDSLSIIPLTDLRMKHRSLTFVFIKIFSIVLNVILNVVFLKYLKMGGEGIFIANIISSFSQMIFMWKYFKYINLKFDMPAFKEMLSYSLPYIPSSMSSVIVQLVDRPIMMMLISSYYVGIYQANFRLSIFINLIISMFDFAWRPFVMEKMNEHDSKAIFSKVFEYFKFIILLSWMFLSFFIEDIIKISIHGFYLISPNYWSGIGIVPIVMLGYVFNGLYINFMIGAMITKKTYYTMYANIISAILSISLNFLLIPKLGIYGSACSVLISYFFLALFMYFVNRKIYPLKYNFKKFFFIFALTLLIYGVIKIPLIANLCNYVQTKIFLFIMYFLIVMASGYFSKEGISSIKKIIGITKNNNIDRG
jgi:O-antigen/teichoic acid export membrane protein